MERTVEANESNAVDHPHQYGHTKDHSSLSFNDGFGISTAFFFFFFFFESTLSWFTLGGMAFPPGFIGIGFSCFIELYG